MDPMYATNRKNNNKHVYNFSYRIEGWQQEDSDNCLTVLIYYY